jgi:glycosyltransferase involved in cell wall biosynthesis
MIVAMSEPSLAVIVTTFERPQHLRRCLASIAAQDRLAGGFELVVCDDGSEDGTARLVADFAAEVGFPVGFMTHPHDGFRPGRCRNDGVRSSAAPYLVFCDGDCVLPPGHLAAHAASARQKTALLGEPCYLDGRQSSRITEDVIRSGNPLAIVPRSVRLRSAISAFRHRYRRRRKLYSGFFSLWREDFERINGFDEEFTGWGCEDDDLGLRLRRSGVKTASIMDCTQSFHLWHPWHPSRVPRWRDGANVDYLERPVRLTRCLHGLQNRDLRDLMIGVVGRPSDRSMATSLLKNLPRPVVDLQDAEVEILFRPGDGRFSGRADCNVLVVTRESAGIRRPARNAHLVFADHSWRGVPAGKTHRLQRLGRLLKLIEGQSSRGSPLP